MTTGEREIVKLLTAQVETDPRLRPEQLPLARQIVQRLAPAIARLVRDEVAIARRMVAQNGDQRR